MRPGLGRRLSALWGYRAKVPSLIIAISLATAAAISVTVAVVAKQWLKEDLHHHAGTVSQSLARTLLVHLARDDVWEAFEAVRAVVSVEPDLDVVVLDRERKVFVSSAPDRLPVGSVAAALSAPLRLAEGTSAQGPAVIDADSDGVPFTVASVPLVSADGERIGVLLMGFSQAAFAARYADAVSTVASISLGFAAVLLPLGWWLGHRLASPVARATDALYRLAEDAAAKSELGTAATPADALSSPPQPTGELQRLEHAVSELEQQLHEREQLRERFRALTELAAVGIGSADADGRMVYVNERAAAIIGLTAAQCLAEGWTRTLHPRDRDRVTSSWRAAAAAGASYHDEFCFQHPGGPELHVIAESSPLAEDHPRTGRVVTIVDVTALKEVEQHRLARAAAEQASKAKSEFLAHMSHELRTPLNAILGYAQLLQRDSTVGPQQRAALRTIHDSGEHLLGLIDELLDLARIEAGKAIMVPSAVNLPRLMAAITDIMRMKAEQKALDFRCDMPAGLPDAVMVDEKRLRQALLNLLGNAVKFTRRGAVTLQVSALERAPDRIALRFAVEDTGAGIAADEIERIFLAFEQAGSPTDRAAGTGLGLAISRQLVRLMGGELKVRSQLGSGSLFWFDLTLDIALALAQSEPVRKGNITGYLGPRRKVLIVDDVEANRAIVVDMLASLGFDTSEARDGHAAVALALSDLPDLVLMDSVMPGLDGLGATQRLRQSPATRDVPVIVMSASTSDADKQKALHTGANAFVAKPLFLDLLLQEIARLLDLTWIFAPTDPDEAVEPDADAPLVVPPQNEIEVLYRLAKVGNMRDIRERAAHVATLGAQYRPFAERLRRLADGCQSRAILQLVSQGRADMP